MAATETLPILKKRMLEYLTTLAVKVEIEGASGDNGESKGAEVVVRDLMNVLYGYDLKLEKKVNAAGFDLCDTSNGVLVQVTSNCTTGKVEECLRTTCERVAKESHLKDFKLFIAFLTMDDDKMDTLRKNAANKLGTPEPDDKRVLTAYPFRVDNIQFDPRSGIIDLNDFLQMMRDDEDPDGQALTAGQLRSLDEILDKFYTPVYLAETICEQFPEKRPLYFPADGQENGLCLQHIYDMLADDTDTWAKEIKERLAIPDTLHYTAFGPPQLFLEDPGRPFLERILPTPAMTLIDQAAESDPKIYDKVMDGTYPMMLRKKLCQVFLDHTGRQFENMAKRCNGLDIEVNRYLGRADLLVALLTWMPSRPQAVKVWYNKCQIGIHHCDGLAVFLLYALVGENCFLSLNRDEIIKRMGGYHK